MIALRLARSFVSLAILLLCLTPSVGLASPPDRVVAFVHVNVVPMDRNRVLRDQTVLVRDGEIVQIGKAIALPETARRIDGHGAAYLSPGLADMHTHADTSEDMKVFLANGVTSVLNMGNASYEFIAQVRPQLNAGKLPGPHFYAAYLVDGSPRYGHFFVKTPAEARWVVRLAKTNGYQFIKVYNDLSPACFDALVEEARRQHMAVVGHGVTKVGLRRQLDAGQLMVAHTEEFLYTVFNHPTDPSAPPDPRQIPSAIAFIKRDRAFVTADLNSYAAIARQWGKPEVVARIMSSDEFRYLSPRWRIDWAKEDYKDRKGSIAGNLQFLTRFTKAMSDAGVPLIAGTDAPTIPGLVPGFSLQDDLHTLEAAGLSRYEALATATRVPGEFIHRALPDAQRFGTVTVGDRADLILSAANPLDDLATLRKPLGVMANGDWYPASSLEALLDGVAAEYHRALAPQAEPAQGQVAR